MSNLNSPEKKIRCKVISVAFMAFCFVSSAWTQVGSSIKNTLPQETFSSNTTKQIPCRLRDSITLKAIYNQLDGDNWTFAATNYRDFATLNFDTPIPNAGNRWDLNWPIDAWHGVELDGMGCVEHLVLIQDSLVGSLPLALADLTSLKQLQLSEHIKLTGSIPEELTTLPALEHLILATNQLEGIIPSSLGDMILLKTLILAQNKDFTNFPVSLTSLENLLFLDISSSDVDGNIPSNIGNLSKLEVLNLLDNNLEGEIPSSIDNLQELQLCYLNNNRLSGTIPIGFTTLGKLETLTLQDNELEGTVSPDFSKLMNLKGFTVAENRLEGMFPDLSGLNLTNLRIHENNFDSLPNLNSITTWNSSGFQARDNHFTFDDILPNMALLPVYNFTYIPQGLIYTDTTIHVLEGDTLFIDLGIDHGISSNVYEWFQGVGGISSGEPRRLVRPNATVAMSGSYRCEVTNPQVPGLTLHTKSIEVLVQTCRSRDSTILAEVFDQMGGSVWQFKETQYFNYEIYGLAKIPNDDSINLDTTWQLDMPIDTWYGVGVNTAGCVDRLILPNVSNLSGSIPINIGDLSALEKLYLANNPGLNGAIPASLYDLSQLKELDLENDSITGNISPAIKSLQSLEHLSLINNELTGPIPAEIGDLSALSTLWLNKNNLVDSIPIELGNLTLLQRLDLSFNQLEGRLPSTITQLSNLEFFYLYNNDLEGTLPEDMDGLSALIEINLNGNQFSGNIPSSIGDIPHLAGIQFSSNHFEGIVPKSFEQLTTLKILILNENELTGFPNLSGITTWNSTSGCQVQNNRLTFAALLPNKPIESISTWEYSPQDSIFKDTTYVLSVGADLLIDLEVDEGLTSSTYYWYKDNAVEPFDSTTINQLEIEKVSLADAGIYHCRVRNDSLPDLELHARPARVEVETDLAQTIFTFETVCYPDDISLAPDSLIVKNQYGQDSLIFVGVTSLQNAISSEGLVAYYRFDGDGNDYSGFGNDGLVRGPSPVADRFGNAGCAYALNGVDDAIEIPHQDWINFSNHDTFTISIWIEMEVQVDLKVDYNEILTKWNDVRENPYPYVIRFGNQFSPNPGEVHCGENDSLADGCSTGGAIVRANQRDYRDSIMHHLVYIKQDSFLALYIDNELIDSVTKANLCEISNTLPMFIGRRGNDAGEQLFFKGKVDDFRMYNRALSLTEISTLFQENNSKPILVDTTICAGEELIFGDDTYSETGLHEAMISVDGPCDSLVMINLTVLESSDPACFSSKSTTTRKVVSPNGDMVNEVLEFDERILIQYPNHSLSIFDRLGNDLYHATPYENDWNGTDLSGQDLPAATYYFVLDLGEGDPIKGYITLVREN